MLQNTINIKLLRLLVLVLISLLRSSTTQEVHKPTCYSEIYCHGPLLHTVQMARIYPDSKTFVDMKMRASPQETMAKFNKFIQPFNNTTPPKSEVRRFVEENFEKGGQEFQPWIPDDWIESPAFLKEISDLKLRDFASKLNEIWKMLGRQLRDDIRDHEELFSIIWVPRPVIVPGGRFREFYYWDTYWILQGLLLSEMRDTTRGILENFLYIVKTYGHVPNGGRIYYLARSQPPFLTPMIKSYLDYTNDFEFIKENFAIMETEFDYWMKNHAVVVPKDNKNYTLYIYNDKSYGPRPESYSEDVESAEIFPDVPKKISFYSQLKAGAESGWDFSSRWFIKNATNKGNLTDIKTMSIVPVELNALLYWNAEILKEFSEKLGFADKADIYGKKAEEIKEAVTAVLWHEEVGSWLDYDMLNSIKRDYFYPTNIVPLWTNCYDLADKEKIVRLVLKYLQNKNIMNYPGGIPSTFEHTGEQWDYPNAWPPLQHMMIVSLNSTGIDPAVRLAYEIAEKWVRANHKAFLSSDAMYEKYDASVPGGHGGGGEYELQLGFGWTNGVVMDLIYRYSKVLTAEDVPTPEPINSGDVATASGQINTVLIALLVSLTAGLIGVCIYKRRSRLQSPRTNPNRSQYRPLQNIPRSGRR